MNPKSIASSLRAAYLEVDPRSLGLGRIVLGLTLILDIARRVPWLRDFYSNAGLLPNHTLLWRPPLPRMFSLMFMSSLPEEGALWFIACFFCFACFTVGYRTRLFHVLSFLLLLSVHNRIMFVENFSGVTLQVVLLWTLFLPLGRRFSVDAVRASLREGRDEGPDDLRAGLPPGDDRPRSSLAVFCILLQLAVIYWFNFLHKTGPTWRDGTAVHYVLHQERIVTALGVWAREHLPFSFWKAMAPVTLAIERTAPILILLPILWPWARLVTVIVLAGMHIGFAMLVNVGVFTPAMLCFYPFLIAGEIWRRGAGLVPRRGRARTVIYDVDCGVCWATVRMLARLDVHRRLTFVPNSDRDAIPDDVDPALLERTMMVLEDDLPRNLQTGSEPPAMRSDGRSPSSRDAIRGRRWTRADGFAEVAAALPLGRLWSWPLRLPIIRGLANRAYDRFAENRTRISVWMGLAACGMPVAPGAATVAAPPATPVRDWLRRRLVIVRELMVAVTLVVLAAEVSVVNPAVPPALRWEHRPEWMVAAIQYTRLFQSWSLFSPDAPTTDEMVVVDAVTRDGRHVDPFNRVGSRVWALPLERIPVRLGQDSFFCDYTVRIPETHQYHQAFLEWVLRYPERTGNPEDAITSFDAFVLRQASPAPGEREPTDVHQERFLHWSAGGGS